MYKYDKIKELREQKEIKQNEIAKILGIKQQQYSRYENGLQEIPLHHMITLAKYYNVTLGYIAGIEERKRKER